MQKEKVLMNAGLKPSCMKESTPREERIRVNKKHLQKLLEECHRKLALLKTTTTTTNPNDDDEDAEKFSSECADFQLCDLIKSTIESPNFIEKLGSVHVSAQESINGNSWDVINDNDLWEDGNIDGDVESDQNSYVFVRQEDIMEGIACFMATYLPSLQQTRELSPNELQEVLSKTFSIKKKKGKLQKAWDGSKVIYNLASWGATAAGIYQNPALFKAASVAFWSSCRVLSELF
ncbi:uncharacterized protein LOC113296889 isoform X2 [Papaver somniferum]|uniref:uncharacterized protein LOC113296889 isoform X2 n=1 Tax=Papaver somniferum TaxID=3469 RepID=UPI000E70023C|nr:uncharacterized protein LOC113296889 isoform X2 [Papaver somniferum]